MLKTGLRMHLASFAQGAAHKMQSWCILNSPKGFSGCTINQKPERHPDLIQITDSFQELHPRGSRALGIIVGLVITLGCMLGGFIAMGGHVSVLIQPWEFVIILGAALGTFFIANPFRS